MPVRYLFGDGVEEMFLDEDGNPQQSRLEAYFGRFLVGPSGSQTGSVPGADLTQLLNTFKTYALQVASQTGIPPFMLGGLLRSRTPQVRRRCVALRTVSSRKRS